MNIVVGFIINSISTYSYKETVSLPLIVNDNSSKFRREREKKKSSATLLDLQSLVSFCSKNISKRLAKSARYIRETISNSTKSTS